MSTDPSQISSPYDSTRSSRTALSSWIDVLGSMRFAISSLSILSIASIIGTVLNQREPFLNYVNQFGPFWAAQFSSAGIVEVYNAWWFILVLAFLIVSTSLCVTRNAPKMIREMRTWRESIRVSSLKAQHHHGELSTPASAQEVIDVQTTRLKQLGYSVKLDTRADGFMVAGKRGATNRLGYIFAHAGIVIVALGGVLDSEMPLRAFSWWLDKKPMLEMTAGAPIPDSVKLPPSNPSFRSNLFVPEGGTASLALINTHGGRYVQELPFAIELKRFKVDYYSTGMPKLFASDVVVIDKATGARREATIKVNEPLYHAGMAIYQSSFDDGGSQLRLVGHSLDGKAPIDIPVEVGGSVKLDFTQQASLNLEITGFRAINVENVGQIDAIAKDQRKFKDSVATVLSPTAKGRSAGLRNVGPSVQYKLRDNTGQAREFSVYQLPVEIDGYPMFLAGVRDSVNDQFQYLRIPADDKGELTEFVRLRKALTDPVLLQTAAREFALKSTQKPSPDSPSSSAQSEQLVGDLEKSAQRALATFAAGGLQSIADFLEKNVPAAERERAAEMVLRMVQSSLWELWQQARLKDGLKPAATDEDNARFLQLAQLALSDSFLFGAPVLFQINEFKEIKASVFQVTRSPGKNIVYFGCLMLTLGVFAMFYIRERRVWCWITPSPQGQTHMHYAMSSTRRSMAVDQDFASFEQRLKEQYGNHPT